LFFPLKELVLMSGALSTSESRLMLITPHPDDEAVACGVVLRRAAGARAAVRIVYAIRFV